MGVFTSFFQGMKISAPEDIDSILIPGEKILYAVRQARIHQLTAPDSIIITTERVIVRRPMLLGLKKETRDFRYEDMGNVTVHKGLMNSTIAIKMRLLSHDLMLFSIPSDIAPKISSAIQEGIDGRYEGIGEDPTRYDEDKIWEAADTIPELISILKERYAKGEITKEQYYELKKELLS